MTDSKLAVAGHFAVMTAALAVLGGCASFDFGKSDSTGVHGASGAGQVIGTQLIEPRRLSRRPVGLSQTGTV